MSNKTLKEMAQMAVQVQDACNLSGVVNSYSQVLSNLRQLPECRGTDWISSHPISVAFADKIASLTGIQFDSKVAMKAHADCLDLSQLG